MNFAVPRSKLLDYLFKDPGKGNFFRMFGYSEVNWERLAQDLLSLATTAPAILKKSSIFGDHYEITGEVIAPNGRKVIITTGWICEPADPQTMRLVTAYPA